MITTVYNGVKILCNTSFAAGSVNHENQAPLLQAGKETYCEEILKAICKIVLFNLTFQNIHSFVL